MQTRRVSSIKIGVRHRKDLGDLDKLAESLETIGLLHPVVIDTHNRLIAGQRRLEAAKLLKWKTVPVTVVDIEAVTLGEFAENACRKDFTASHDRLEDNCLKLAAGVYSSKPRLPRQTKSRQPTRGGKSRQQRWQTWPNVGVKV
jgi:ParB-like chromosome segregation protein Spo0J